MTTRNLGRLPADHWMRRSTISDRHLLDGAVPEAYGASVRPRHGISHSIGSEAVIGALKGFNFLATANSRNIPLDSHVALDPSSDSGLDSGFPHFLSFGGIPLKYQSRCPSRSRRFFGEPLLFYVHPAYFAEVLVDLTRWQTRSTNSNRHAVARDSRYLRASVS